jgi:hypothetical protein
MSFTDGPHYERQGAEATEDQLGDDTGTIPERSSDAGR